MFNPWVRWWVGQSLWRELLADDDDALQPPRNGDCAVRNPYEVSRPFDLECLQGCGLLISIAEGHRPYYIHFHYETQKIWIPL